MRILPGLFASLVLAGALCSAVQAVTESPRINRDQPIQIKSNELSSDASGKVATFIGSVVARQGDVTIFCDRLVVHYGAENRDISRVEALGNVRVLQGNRQAHAGRATFDNRAGTIILEDNPRISQGGDKITGKVITFYLNEQKSVVTGGADRRVEAELIPKGDGVNVRSKP